MYYQYGSIVFDKMYGPSGLTDTDGISLAQIDLFGVKPRLQFVGYSLKDLSMSISMDYAFCDPKDQLEKLAEIKNARRSEPLISGAGEIIGQFFIKSISKVVVKTTDDGIILLANVDVQFIEDAYPKTASIKPLNARPFPLIQAPFTATPPAPKMVEVSTAMSAGSEVKSLKSRALKAKDGTVSNIAAVQKALQVARRLQTKITDIRAASGQFAYLQDSINNAIQHLLNGDIALAIDSIDDIDIRINNEVIPFYSEASILLSRKKP